MKAYTDLEQSKKLAEILPLESADMYWLNRHIDLTETKYEVFVIDKSNKYVDFFKSYAVAIDNNEIIPCWSLAALLEYMNRNFYNISLNYCGSEYSISFDDSEEYKTITKDYSIDAAFDMVVWLKENEKI